MAKYVLFKQAGIDTTDFDRKLSNGYRDWHTNNIIERKAKR